MSATEGVIEEGIDGDETEERGWTRGSMEMRSRRGWTRGSREMRPPRVTGGLQVGRVADAVDILARPWMTPPLRPNPAIDPRP